MTILKMMKSEKGFNDKEKSISRFFLENYEKIVDMPSREVGTYTYTSSSSVVRFCQKLGCKGYSDFKVKFLSEVKSAKLLNLDDEISLNDKDNAISVLDKITSLNNQVISETRNELSIENIIKITNYILKAEYIDFFAYDLNLYLAEYACNQFFHCGKISNVYSASNAQQLLALTAKQNHLGIFISRDGENSKLIAAAKTLKKSKVKTVVITMRKDSTLASICDEYVHASYAYKIEELGSIMFSTSVKYIIDIFFSMVFVSQYDKSMNLNKTYDTFWSRGIFK